jgi:hypothetical protein
MGDIYLLIWVLGNPLGREREKRGEKREKTHHEGNLRLQYSMAYIHVAIYW